MRKTLSLALLVLVLVSLVTATWAGHPQAAAALLAGPIELVWLADAEPVETLALVAVPLTRPIATALLRGPPSSGLRPQTTRTTDKETAWPRSAASPPSSPT